MSPNATAIWMMLLFVLLLGLDLKQAGGYSCPSCGTTNEREHGEHCAWAKHYGEDL